MDISGPAEHNEAQQPQLPVKRARGRPKGTFRTKLGKLKAQLRDFANANEAANLSENPELATTNTNSPPSPLIHTEPTTAPKQERRGRPKGSKNKVLDPEVVERIVASDRKGRVQNGVNYNVKLAFKKLREGEDSKEGSEVLEKEIMGEKSEGKEEPVVQKVRGRGRPPGAKNKNKSKVMAGGGVQGSYRGRGRPRKGEEPWRRVVESTPVPSESPSKKVLMKNSPIVRRSFGGFLGTPVKVAESVMSGDEAEDEDETLDSLIGKNVEEAGEQTGAAFALKKSAKQSQTEAAISAAPSMETEDQPPVRGMVFGLLKESEEESSELDIMSDLPKVVENTIPEVKIMVTPQPATKILPPKSSLILSQKTAEQTTPTEGLAKFRKLPKEIQGMIWGIALQETTPFVEVVFDRRKRQFKVSGPSSAILSVCGPSRTVKGVEPVYLNSIVSPGDPSIVYLRPDEDVLYIPRLEDISIDAFFARAENQAICKLGITAATSAQLFSSSHTEEAKPGQRLMMNLKNLKRIYLIDGTARGDEEHVDHTTSYDIELVDLVERSDELRLNISAAWVTSDYDYNQPVEPWDLDGLSQICLDFHDFQKRSEDEAMRSFPRPRFEGKVIVRTKRAEVSAVSSSGISVTDPVTSAVAAPVPASSSTYILTSLPSHLPSAPPAIEHQPQCAEMHFPDVQNADMMQWDDDQYFNNEFDGSLEWDYGATNGGSGDVGYVF